MVMLGDDVLPPSVVALERHASQPIDAALSGAKYSLAGMSAARQSLGLEGERVAARWLRTRGWRIVAHRFRSGRRDIDLVVERAGTVAFVEVKARRADCHGDPVEAVNWRKQRELGRSAAVWVERHGSPGLAYRFDVIGVLFTPAGVRVRHVEQAFSVQNLP